MQEQQMPVSEYFFRMHYGTIPTRMEEDDVKRFGTALVAIVGADGLSERERWAYREIGKLMGVPEQALEHDLSTDVSSLNLEELMTGFGKAPARALLYTAIVIASVDGYSDKEKAAAARIAKVIGVSPAELATIEGLVESDLALRRARGSFLFPEGNFA